MEGEFPHIMQEPRKGDHPLTHRVELLCTTVNSHNRHSFIKSPRTLTTQDPTYLIIGPQALLTLQLFLTVPIAHFPETLGDATYTIPKVK